ncbi:MAG: hypothetical protein V2A79_03380 [Planctomycetota bacterium]
MRQRLLVMVVSGASLWVGQAQAVPDRLLQIIPADAPAVLLLDRASEAPTENPAMTAGGFAAALLQHTRDMGLLRDVDTTVSLVADALALQPELARYPRAVVLLDVKADPLSGGGFRLGGIAAGLIVLTGGDHLRLEGQIQLLLNLYATRDTARLTQRSANGTTIHTLTEQRLPDWAPIEWGAVHDCYLITVGSGAFERLASVVGGTTKGLGAGEWFAEAHRRCRGPAARWEWYLAFDVLRARLIAVMGEQPREVLAALGLGEVARGLWTVGSEGRVVDAACMFDGTGGRKYLPLSVTGPAIQAFDRVIPPGVRYVALMDARPREMIPRACKAYLAARSPYFRERITARWAALESELGINTETDLLGPLGRHVIVHDFPQHPLGLPLLRTVLVEIDGSPEAVRTALDRLLAHAQAYLAEHSGTANLIRLKRDEDGVWYLQFGLYGPALVVTDRWVVVSYSPQAVRQNVSYLSPQRQAASQPSSAVP